MSSTFIHAGMVANSKIQAISAPDIIFLGHASHEKQSATFFGSDTESGFFNNKEIP
jgi:hypothetical protein